MLAIPDFDRFADWTCSGCRQEFFGPDRPEPEPLCRDCERRHFEQNARQVASSLRSRVSRPDVLRSAGCPRRYVRNPFDEKRIPGGWPRHPRRSDADKHQVQLESWIGRRWSSLVIKGDLGLGKTMLATELLWRAFLRGRSIFWIRADDLVDRVYSQRDPSAYRRLLEADAAVLDELGRGYSGEAWNLLDRVIAQRHQDERPTIVTMNGSLQRLYEFAPAIADRLIEGLIVTLPKHEGSQRGRSS